MVGPEDVCFQTSSEVIVVITVSGITCLGGGRVERLQDPGVGQTRVKCAIRLLNCFKPLRSNLFNEK